ncbi:MAG: LLM class flavin-dependent oxidoreductase [Cytophagia bacterium]|jgi:alkanesulfonate monooxygenase|nr:MAG: LLM class flavin-dependent oxidoreductase [Cytophagales bacterium]TAG37868.1 MAG: LLM class flavin-dependent oxidoreductase [Cytophagia bacterium]TAG71293.1 MAG: LLM class flavin-dependent oxidoreductase [Runella slithyformis]TAG79130.1 MAG: LLM class flavin-dependent oxidoreductase [Cytophagales bacterium]
MPSEPITSRISNIRTEQRVCEVAWFDDLCGGDTEFLGNIDPTRRSSYEHCKDILLTADRLGYKNILLPTSYVVGQEVLTYAGAAGAQTQQINLLAAIRTGEIHPPMLARHIATLDHILKGRLTINIINSDLPGTKEDHEMRYKRCEEVIEILKQGWTQDRVVFDGEIYKGINLPAAPVKPYQQNGGPLLYFGGISPGSKEVCAKHCDVFLMWPEPEQSIYATMQDMAERADKQGRKLDFGFRAHVIVRKTEEEARAWAKRMMSKFDLEQAEALKHRTQDSKSAGVLRQDEFRKQADADDYIEPYLWGGIGRARSGCGAAIVGNPEQVLEKLNRYMDMGIRSFILSGYPLVEECEYFGELVLPHLPNVKLSELQGRTPQTEPVTPLTTGELKYA